MSRWLRINEDCIDNPKILKLPEALRWQWVALLCVASKNGGVLPPIDDVALCLRVPEAKAAEFITKLVQAKLIDRVGDHFEPHNWNARQYIIKDGDGEIVDSKCRYVYVVSTASADSAVKIGISKNPWARIGELQTGYPEKLSIVATFRTKKTSESDIHLLLAKYRRQGEWFDLPANVMDTILAAHTAKSDYGALMLLIRSELRITTKDNDRSSYVATPRTEAEAQTDTKQSRADASAPANEDSKKKLVALQFGITALFISRQQAVPNLDRCALWFAQGYASGTVLAAIEAVLKRGKPISTLDYFDGAIRDRHAADLPVAALVDTMADWHVIIEGTQEEVCWQQYSRETTGRPMFICDQIHNGNTVRGAKKPTLFPPGYDEATGERIAPQQDEDAA